MNILLVSPKTPDTFWSFAHVLRFVAKKASFPPLGLLTVAAMLPREWELKRVDLNVEQLEDARLRLSWADVRAFVQSFWWLGVWDRGRFAYWQFFLETLLRHPRRFRTAIELAIIGLHFRRVAAAL